MNQIDHPLAHLPPAKNMLEAAYRAIMLVTQNGGREQYASTFKLRGTPSHKSDRTSRVLTGNFRGRLVPRRVTGFRI